MEGVDPAGVVDLSELCRAFMDAAPAGVAIFDREMRYLEASSRWIKDFGLEGQALKGRSHYDILPDDAGRWENIQSRCLAEEAANGSDPFPRADGQVDWVHWAARPWHHDDGSIGGVIVFCELVTDRVRAEKALRESEQRFSAIFHNSPVGIAITDLRNEKRIVDVNSAWLEMMGLARDEVIGRTAVELDLWVDRPIRDEIYRTIASPNAVWTGNIQLRRRDGAILEVGVCVRRIEIDGQPFAMAIGHDFTEHRRAERTIKRMNRALLALTSGNESLMHADREQNLLDDMCRILVGVAGYKAAGVRFAESDPGKSLRLVAFDGSDRDALETVPLSWADVDTGRGPTGSAVRTGEAQAAQDCATDDCMAPWRRIMAEIGIASVIALPLKDSGGVFGALTIYGAEPNAFDPEEARLLAQLANDLAFGITALRDHLGKARLEREIREGMKATIAALSGAVEARDAYTAGHQRRVAELAAAIAREMKLPEAQIEGILIGGQLHDIGKISVPAEFLSKPSRLTPGEFEVVKGHVQAGYEILKDIQFPWPIAEMVLQHHERLDGSGYPNGLKSDAILPEAKILAVADTVEAMATHRPYRPSRGIEAALAEVEKEKGRLFDAAAVDACLRLFREKGFKLG